MKGGGIMAANASVKGRRISEKEAFSLAQRIQSASIQISISEIYLSVHLNSHSELTEDICRSIQQVVFLGREESSGSPNFWHGSFLMRNGKTILCLDGSSWELRSILGRCGSHLQSLEISNSNLTLLDLRDLYGLERLYLRNNSALTDIHGISQRITLTTLQISNCNQLSALDLSGCKSLKHLIGIDNLPQLTELNMGSCYSLTELPILDKLDRLNSLNLSECSQLTQLPSLDKLTQLKHLNLSKCISLTQLPKLDQLRQLTDLSLEGCSSLTQLPDLDGLTRLTNLHLSECIGLRQLPSLNSLTALTTLVLRGCSNLTQLPDLERLEALTCLDLGECRSLTQLTGLDGLTRLTNLHLNECISLRQLPDLNRLTALTTLELNGCSSLTKLPALEQLEELTRLDLGECRSLTQLPGLDHLTKLTHLNLTHCSSITQIPNLDNLTKLTGLYLGGCSSLRQVPSLDKLTGLTSLYFWGCNSLTQLPNLAMLTEITDLELSGCAFLTQLPDSIRNMKKLKKLYLCDLELTELPDWFPGIAEKFSTRQFDFGRGKQKAVINLHGTTVEGVDMSIFEQPYEMVLEWFEKRKQGQTRPLNEIKVVFLGDGEAGKSLTIARMRNNGGDPVGYVDVRTPGIVIDEISRPINGQDAKMHVWDFGGQEILHSMHRIFLTERTMYVVIVDGRIGNQDERASYWLHNIQSFAKDAPVILVLNKLDNGLQADVNATNLYNKYHGLKRIVKLSAKEYSQEEFNRTLMEPLCEEIEKTGFLNVTWPSDWFRVKQELEKKGTEYVMRGSRYQEICRNCSVNAHRKELLHWFNDLGVSFCCYDDYKLDNYVILKPNWITNALYIILFNERQGAIGGLVPHETIYRMLGPDAPNRDQIERVLPGIYYEGYDVQYVLDVIRKFKLSFRKNGEYEFIPMLADRDAKPVAREYEQDKDVLEFRMQFDYLPNNILHSLMVDRQQELDMDNVWLTGARFRLPELGLSAVVVIDGNILRFFIRHQDKTHRPNTYLTMLKANVDRIWSAMGLKEPICQVVHKKDGRQDVFDYAVMKAMVEAGQLQIFSMSWKQMLPISDILNQSAPERLTDEKKLLAKILAACQHLQGESDYQISTDTERNKGLEDKRNRRIRDDLEIWGYTVKDQPQYGRSGTGKSIGELDILVYNEQRQPWTVIEALRLSKYETGDWNHHLDKLLYNYNYFGAHSQYLLTYVDCRKEDFGGIWTAFKAHIQGQSGGGFPYVEGSFVDLNDPRDPLFVKKSLCRYNCGGQEITVYHIFAQIDLP